MFDIKIRLAYQNWGEYAYGIDRSDMALAYVSAIRTVKAKLLMDTVDFIALGSGEYIIWADGKCQGYMSIKKIDPEPEAEGTDEE